MPRPKNYLEGLGHPVKTGNVKVDAIIALLDDWFWMIEDGVTDKRLPNPVGRKVTTEEADRLIKHLDDDAAKEVHNSGYWEKRNIDLPPDFNRLKGLSRIAFAQAILEAKEKFDAKN